MICYVSLRSFRPRNMLQSLRDSINRPRETDVKQDPEPWHSIAKFPASWTMLVYYMVTAWFVAMWLGGIFKTFLKKVKVWNRLLRTVPKLVKNPKPPIPPDPNCSQCIYGAWLRWQRIRNVIVIRHLLCVDLGTTPLTELPKVPNFCQSQQKEEEPCSCVLEAN